MALEYETLEIELGRCSCGRSEVRILDSPIDRPREAMHLSREHLREIQLKVDHYDRLILSQRSTRSARDLASEIGNDLFEILTPGAVGECVRETLLLLDQDRQIRNSGVRLRLSFGGPQDYDSVLANLPWELAYDPRGGGRFLGAEPQNQIVRFLNVTRRIAPLSADLPLRVLAVLSSPTSQRGIDLDDQELRLLRILHNHPDRFEVYRLPSPTLECLRNTLSEHEDSGQPFHILHFLGHGEFAADGHGALYFENLDRSEHIVQGQVLASQLSAFRHLRLVVLASCSGAQMPRRDGQSPFTGCASALIANNIPAVIAMQFIISESAAATFTSALYAKIASGKSIEEAVAEGRLGIQASQNGGFEWATPVLFLRSPDGHLLDLGESNVEGARNPKPARSTESVTHAVQVGATKIRSEGRLTVAAVKGRNRGRVPELRSTRVEVNTETLDSGSDLEIAGIVDQNVRNDLRAEVADARETPEKMSS